MARVFVSVTVLLGGSLTGCAPNYAPPPTCNQQTQQWQLNVGMWTPPAGVTVPAPGQGFGSCGKDGGPGPSGDGDDSVVAAGAPVTPSPAYEPANTLGAAPAAVATTPPRSNGPQSLINVAFSPAPPAKTSTEVPATYIPPVPVPPSAVPATATPPVPIASARKGLTTADLNNMSYNSTHTVPGGTYSSPHTVSGPSTPVALPLPPPEPVWYLTSNSLVGADLKSWGTQAGWTVIWQANQDWPVPATTRFQGSFQTAATQVLNDLAGQGANIRGKFYTGNQTLVISQPGASDGQ